MNRLNSRSKGMEGQRIFRLMLQDRDWTVISTACGMAVEDLVATDPDGISWSVEVKDWKEIKPEHRAQARMQSVRRNLPWMLANHIYGTRSWLVQRQGRKPVVWHEKKADEVGKGEALSAVA